MISVLILGLCTGWKRVVLVTFQRHIVPASYGPKWLEYVNGCEYISSCYNRMLKCEPGLGQWGLWARKRWLCNGPFKGHIIHSSKSLWCPGNTSHIFHILQRLKRRIRRRICRRVLPTLLKRGDKLFWQSRFIYIVFLTFSEWTACACIKLSYSSIVNGCFNVMYSL
jgi:hypothetical protein